MKNNQEFISEIYRRYDMERQKQKKRRRATVSVCAGILLCTVLAVPFSAYFFADINSDGATEHISGSEASCGGVSGNSSSIFEHFDFGSASSTDPKDGADGKTGDVPDGDSHVMTNGVSMVILHVTIKANETKRVWFFDERSDIESVLACMLDEIRDDSAGTHGYTLEITLANGNISKFYYPNTDTALETFLNELEGE